MVNLFQGKTATSNIENMTIEYILDKRQRADQIIELYDNSGLPRLT